MMEDGTSENWISNSGASYAYTCKVQSTYEVHSLHLSISKYLPVSQVNLVFQTLFHNEQCGSSKSLEIDYIECEHHLLR